LWRLSWVLLCVVLLFCGGLGGVQVLLLLLLLQVG
jgi:hypothetical protein